jgi:anti-sigma regulatory factor (Ser/Thr protein kinase)
MSEMETKLNRQIEALGDLFAAIEGFCSERGVSETVLFAMKLAGEELFTNLVRHNEGGSDHILLELDYRDNCIILGLTDYEVEPFDITQTGPVDVTAPLLDRTPGGLGLHLVKSIVDKLTYEYNNRTMRITAVKGLEGGNV